METILPQQLPALSKHGFWKVYFCSLFLGFLGVDRFIVGKTKTGIIKLLTLGGLGLWTFVDCIQVLRGKSTDSQGLLIPNPRPIIPWAIFMFVFIIFLMIVGFYSLAFLLEKMIGPLKELGKAIYSF